MVEILNNLIILVLPDVQFGYLANMYRLGWRLVAWHASNGRRRRRNTYLRLSASFIILRKGYDLFVLVLLFLISQDAFSVFGGHPEILNFWYLRVITGVEAELGIQVVVFMRLPPLQLRPGHLSWWQ